MDKGASFSERFLSEALPLISTYLSGPQVELGVKEVGLDTSQDWGHELREFIAVMRLRFALACCNGLVGTLREIEAGCSQANALVRDRTKGVIRGRLDIPLYIAERSSARLFSKSYPIIFVDQTPDTPENKVAKQVMVEINRRLYRAKGLDRSAERKLVGHYAARIAGKLRQYPWCKVGAVSGSLRRVTLEAKHRIEKRQTGNETSYKAMIELAERWLFDLLEAGPITNSGAVTKALLAFPSSPSFHDRIFEIWCLQELAQAFMRCGALLHKGPNPLSMNLSAPIFVLLIEDRPINIWFQKGLEPTLGSWLYDDGQPLRGIPDITVETNGKLLLVDAKNRLTSDGTRSEETYKMLGYFENFRRLLSPLPHGIVCFTSVDDFHRRLHSHDGGKLELVSANPLDVSSCNFKPHLDAAIREWLQFIKVEH